jgi:hypothetical protein
MVPSNFGNGATTNPLSPVRLRTWFLTPQELRISGTSRRKAPANDGKLRPANIQGFEILQWRSSSPVGGSVIINPKP